MKMWLKSEVCETYEQCTNALFTREKSNVAALKKKKKKKKKLDFKTQTRKTSNPNEIHIL